MAVLETVTHLSSQVQVQSTDNLFIICIYCTFIICLIEEIDKVRGPIFQEKVSSISQFFSRAFPHE